MIEEYALRIGQLLNKITKQSNRPETLLKWLINGGEKDRMTAYHRIYYIFAFRIAVSLHLKVKITL